MQACMRAFAWYAVNGVHAGQDRFAGMLLLVPGAQLPAAQQSSPDWHCRLGIHDAAALVGQGAAQQGLASIAGTQHTHLVRCIHGCACMQAPILAYVLLL
jgi:hypothetical protein